MVINYLLNGMILQVPPQVWCGIGMFGGSIRCDWILQSLRAFIGFRRCQNTLLSFAVWSMCFGGSKYQTSGGVGCLGSAIFSPPFFCFAHPRPPDQPLPSKRQTLKPEEITFHVEPNEPFTRAGPPHHREFCWGFLRDRNAYTPLGVIPALGSINGWQVP